LPQSNGEEQMPTAFGTSEHWRQRAQEARDMAKNIDDLEAKRSMLDIADLYERIAARAEAKREGVPLQPSKGQ
jgi:hypothetical protein